MGISNSQPAACPDHALCLLKYMEWTWVVNGAYGLPSQAGRVVVAQRWSLMYFWAGLLTEGALVASLTFILRFDRTQLTGGPKIAVRLLVALAISVVGTVCTAFLLSVLGGCCIDRKDTSGKSCGFPKSGGRGQIRPEKLGWTIRAWQDTPPYVAAAMEPRPA